MQSFRFMAKEHHRFYQIKSRIQADANIRLFSRSMMKMIVINSQTSWNSISLWIHLWPIHLEIIYRIPARIDGTMEILCTKSLLVLLVEKFLAQFYRYSLILCENMLKLFQDWSWHNLERKNFSQHALNILSENSLIEVVGMHHIHFVA